MKHRRGKSPIWWALVYALAWAIFVVAAGLSLRLAMNWHNAPVH